MDSEDLIINLITVIQFCQMIVMIGKGQSNQLTLKVQYWIRQSITRGVNSELLTLIDRCNF